MIASYNGHVEVVRVLIEGLADVNKTTTVIQFVEIEHSFVADDARLSLS